MNTLHPLPLAAAGTGVAAAARAVANPEAVALAVLQSSTDLHAKARACQDLATIGGTASVPALVALLTVEHLADYARSGLESIQDPAAGKALRDALPRLQGRGLAGAVNSLGVRREKAAVPELRTLALDPKRGVAEEAVASLGMIGTTEAARTLEQILVGGGPELRTAAAHAALVAAERLAHDNDPAGARRLLAGVAKAKPSAHLVAAAERQTTKIARVR